jgi:hypothetical protein
MQYGNTQAPAGVCVGLPSVASYLNNDAFVPLDMRQLSRGPVIAHPEAVR